MAVQQLSPGHVLVVDGLSFITVSGVYLGASSYRSLRESLYFPVNLQRVVLSLLPKNGNLALLKNWRPASLLCLDYKILSKCLV